MIILQNIYSKYYQHQKWVFFKHFSGSKVVCYFEEYLQSLKTAISGVDFFKLLYVLLLNIISL